MDNMLKRTIETMVDTTFRRNGINSQSLEKLSPAERKKILNLVNDLKKSAEQLTKEIKK